MATHPHGILVVEDNDAIRALIVMVLEDDYSVECAPDVESAIAIARNSARVDLVICDINLPGGSGADLVDEIARIHPSISTILISGGRVGDELSASDPTRVFLAKPFGAAELRSTVGRLLGERPG